MMLSPLLPLAAPGLTLGPLHELSPLRRTEDDQDLHVKQVSFVVLVFGFTPKIPFRFLGIPNSPRTESRTNQVSTHVIARFKLGLPYMMIT